jgi:antitoxin (DNA-binding transcriptional repressor) of toxin-antitoxin stability system
MIAIRELRADLAAAVRRAGAGQRVTISIGGRPIAQLGPLEVEAGQTTMDDLVAAGLIMPPRRLDAGDHASPTPIWSGMRLDRALREVRG